MIDLTDPSATEVREALHAHAHDIGDPSVDLATRVERRALALRRQRALALSGGVAVVVAAALAIPLSLSGSTGAGSRIKVAPPGASTGPASTARPIVADDPTTWPFRGDAHLEQALVAAATTQVNGTVDRTTEWKVQPLYAGQGPYGDRYLAFVAIPADPTKSVMFGAWQQPTSGSGFLIQPYDIGQQGQISWKTLNIALSTGSIPYVVILAAPGSSEHFDVRQGGASTGTCTAIDGAALCAGADEKTDVVQVLDAQGSPVGAPQPVHWNSRS